MQNDSGSTRLHLGWHLAISSIAAITMAYLIGVKFPLLEVARQYRLALFVGAVGVCQGTLWCVVFGFAQSIDRRAKLMAINSFGLLQLFAGLTLIFSLAEFRRLMFVAGGAMVISLLASFVAPGLSKPGQKASRSGGL